MINTRALNRVVFALLLTTFIGVLGLFLLHNYSSNRLSYNHSVAYLNIIGRLISSYSLKKGYLPSYDYTKGYFTDKEGLMLGEFGEYVSLPEDGWGNRLRYRKLDNGLFALWSTGKDLSDVSDDIYYKISDVSKSALQNAEPDP